MGLSNYDVNGGLRREAKVGVARVDDLAPLAPHAIDKGTAST